MSDYLRASIRRVGRALRRGARAVRPGPRAWRGAARGVAVVTALVFTACVWALLSGSVLDPVALLVPAGVLVLALLAGALVLWILDLQHELPRAYRRALVLSFVVLLPFLIVFEGGGLLVLLAVIFGGASLVGASTGVLAQGGLHDTTRAQRLTAVLGGLSGAAGLALGLAWIRGDGTPAAAPPGRAAGGAAVAPLDLPDPAEPGPYRVAMLHYGSGKDRHRAAFGDDVDLVTTPVDGSLLLDGWDGPDGWARTRFWGFDAEALPLQGTVQYPEGDGPFPLVLVVHGNHGMEDFSDPGYVYLGELLASRGYIFVSVDENFLNSSILDLLGGPDGGLDEENDARGWLLLEHLRQWRAWNAEAASPFYGRVDLDRVALVGHSRGGEAVAVAAAFNRLPRYPDDATLTFDYGFGIQAVVAIAPVDGKYRPADTETPLRDLSYFVLHGAHDGDVSSYAGGMGQYERVRFTDGAYRFKAGLYIAGANHGQFNTTWGRSDVPEPFARFLNLAPLLPAAEQERIAKVYVSAFLDATLRGATGYLPLFRDHRTAPAWLPETVYLHQFEDSRMRFVATFDEDLDVTSTTLDGGMLAADRLTVWREQRVEMKSATKESRAAYLGWMADATAAGAPARYTIALPPGSAPLDPSQALVFSLADADESPEPKHKKKPEDSEEDDDDKDEVIDLTVELADRAGRTVRLPLSRYAFLQPQVEAQVVKSRLFVDVKPAEPVFQLFALPLADFAARDPAFDVAALAEVRFVFDQTPAGVVILDDVGFVTPPGGPQAGP
jgi:dienelactone hydrolase